MKAITGENRCGFCSGFRNSHIFLRRDINDMTRLARSDVRTAPSTFSTLPEGSCLAVWQGRLETCAPKEY